MPPLFPLHGKIWRIPFLHLRRMSSELPARLPVSRRRPFRPSLSVEDSRRDSTIVAGGSHFTLMAETILKSLKELDYIILGEGEIAFSQFLQDLSRGGKGRGVKGVAYRDNGKVILNERHPPIPNLDSLPFPAYHLIDVDKEVYYWHGMGRRAFGLSTSRGCGDRCAYCSESRFWEGVWRGRSGKKIVEEISYLNRQYGKTLFIFNENTFNWSRRRVEEFLDELGKSGLRIHFWFQSRIKDISEMKISSPR